ncbi:MAG: MraY family glycosyltransferase [Desulfobacterales bacterium]
MIFLSTLLISLFITMALIPIFKTIAVKMNAMDFPNPRKVHLSPMPKIGGIAMAMGILVPVALYANGDPLFNSILIGAWIVVIFGVVDDFKNLGYKGKFVGQVLAALVVIFYGGMKIQLLGDCMPEGAILPDLISIPLTLLAIVGVTNAINLSDGLDGLAGGSSLLIFICIGYLAYTGLYQPVNHLILVMAAAIIGSIFGFLRFNTYPATVFMGDAGSQLLGFLAITLSLGLTQCSTPLSPFLPLLLVGFPVLDTLTVMAERISNGRSPFKADQNHFHHKLLRLGLFHTEAVVTIYILTAFLVASAFVFRFHSEWFLLIFYLVFSGIIVFGFVISDRFGWTLQRFNLIDHAIKGRLKILKERFILIKVSFHFVEFVLPLMVIISCLIPAEFPFYFSLIYLALAAGTAITWIFFRDWLTGMLRVAFYLLVPPVLWLGNTDLATWIAPRALQVYNLAFVALAMFVVLTLKFTRRQKGFKATPMDFLILVIALVVPNLPDSTILSFNMGFLAVKLIVLFFSFEILIGELRGQTARLGVAIVAALLLAAVRGLL